MNLYPGNVALYLTGTEATMLSEWLSYAADQYQQAHDYEHAGTYLAGITPGPTLLINEFLRKMDL